MIKDSGNRREFETGAVRDIQEGKGRCDLLPLDVCSSLFTGSANEILSYIYRFTSMGDVCALSGAIFKFAALSHESDLATTGALADTLLEVSIHFEEGAEKYGEFNWQKGIPVKCYIDSAVRHLLKYLRRDADERHDRALVWNLLCCIWTCEHMPELNSYAKKEEVKEP